MTCTPHNDHNDKDTVTDPSERENSLSTLWICHPMHTDRLANLDAVHILRRNENILFLVGLICGVDLVDHERMSTARNESKDLMRTMSLMLIRRLTASMKTSNSSDRRSVRAKTSKLRLRLLTEASERASNRLPKGQQQADCGKGLLASTERARVLLPALGSRLIVRLHLWRAEISFAQSTIFVATNLEL